MTSNLITCCIKPGPDILDFLEELLFRGTELGELRFWDEDLAAELERVRFGGVEASVQDLVDRWLELAVFHYGCLVEFLFEGLVELRIIEDPPVSEVLGNDQQGGVLVGLDHPLFLSHSDRRN